LAIKEVFEFRDSKGIKLKAISGIETNIVETNLT